MKTTQVSSRLLRLFVIGTVLIAANFARAAELFFDEFDDRSITNDLPLASNGTAVKWTATGNLPGDYDASSGDFVLTSNGNSMDAQVLNIASKDLSIRSRVRSSSVHGGAIVTARDSDPLGDGGNYFGGVSYYPDRDGTILFLGRRDIGGDRFFYPEVVVLPFDVTTHDAMLQLDVIGDQVSLWGWKAGDPMPRHAQVTVTDATHASPGVVGIFNRAGGNGDNVATFRFVQVADTHIRLPGDLNTDNVLDEIDIDLLNAQIRLGVSDTRFDLTGDDRVDVMDRNIWVKDLKSTWFGDANLDGKFNSRDLVEVFSLGQYHDDERLNSGWSAGDWDGDGDFDAGDLVTAFADGGFEHGPLGEVNAVPEPTSLVTLVGGSLAGIGIGMRMRDRT